MEIYVKKKKEGVNIFMKIFVYVIKLLKQINILSFVTLIFFCQGEALALDILGEVLPAIINIYNSTAYL